MTKVTFVSAGGDEFVVDAELGQPVMRAAVAANVAGVVAECGGNMSCGTCHVFIDELWVDRLEAAEAEEQEMLDYLEERADNSRLSCQIEVTADLDGLVVRTPETQSGV